MLSSQIAAALSRLAQLNQASPSTGVESLDSTAGFMGLEEFTTRFKVVIDIHLAEAIEELRRSAANLETQIPQLYSENLESSRTAGTFPDSPEELTGGFTQWFKDALDRPSPRVLLEYITSSLEKITLDLKSGIEAFEAMVKAGPDSDPSGFATRITLMDLEQTCSIIKSKIEKFDQITLLVPSLRERVESVKTDVNAQASTLYWTIPARYRNRLTYPGFVPGPTPPGLKPSDAGPSELDQTVQLLQLLNGLLRSIN
jgi:hypothetical protein